MKKLLFIATISAFAISLPALADGNIHTPKKGTMVLQSGQKAVQSKSVKPTTSYAWHPKTAQATPYKFSH